jgi:hypothetical protein
MTKGNPTERADRQLMLTDNFDDDLRACVHEFGFAIVHALAECHVRDPRRIRHLVHEIWDGARQPRQRLYDGSATLEKLDWLLVQAGANITAPELLRFLWDRGMTFVPRDPTQDMLDMLVDIDDDGIGVELPNAKRRLRESIESFARRCWPFLFVAK